MDEIRIDPLFAAFAFESADASRKAWRKLRDSDKLKGISAWAVVTPDRTAFFVVILGEEERRQFVDEAAEIVMNQPGCLGNHVLDEAVKETLANRRYGAIAELRKHPGERELRQVSSWGAGVTINRDGTLRERMDG